MTVKTSYTLSVFPDKRGEWRWHFVAANGKTIADSGEGYATRANAIRAARRLRIIASEAKLERGK